MLDYFAKAGVWANLFKNVNVIGYEDRTQSVLYHSRIMEYQSVLMTLSIQNIYKT